MKKMNFVLLLILMITTALTAQNHKKELPGKEVINTQSEKKAIERLGEENTLSFDDNWLFSRFGLQADGSTLTEPVGIENPETDDTKWRKLDLPHDWAIEGPFRIELEGETGKLPYKGIGWYRKHFSVPAEDAGKQVFIDFDGAMAYAQVWLNGEYIGTWPYGYSSFRMDLTPFLRFGKPNVIAVRLDTEKWESRWYPGAGIYRHVWLVKTNPVHVGHWGTFITTNDLSDALTLVNMEVTIENQGKKAVETSIRTRIFELDSTNSIGSVVGTFIDSGKKIEAGKKAVISTNATITNPKRWDVNSPNRYVAQTNIIVKGNIVDTYNTSFGIRTLEFTARNGFLLNGRRVAIQGTCNHHDMGALGTAVNTSALRRQLSILKEMGCNSLRTSHNPSAPELLELADQMGFLVWDEAFDCWKTGKRDKDYNKLFDEWHEKDLKSMVDRDRNHPSVFIWSIGNEIPDQKNVEMTKHLAGIVHDEDPTRPVSNGYNDPDNSREAGSANEVDIMGVNYFFGQQAKWDADPRYKDKPTLGSETSSCVTSRGEYFFDKDYKNWQISSYDSTHPSWGCYPDEQFRTNAEFPNILGEFVWTGFDYLGEPTPYNSDEVNLADLRNDPSKKAELEKKLEELNKTSAPSRSSYFGIIDLAGFPKDRFYLYQSLWRPDFPMAHILPHWNWNERIGLVTPVQVYTSGDEAELFLNGKSLGRKAKRAGLDFRLAWNNVIYEPGELKVVAYKGGNLWATEVVKTTGEATKLLLSADRNIISSSGEDLVFITVKVQDSDGQTVPQSHPLVKFEIIGPGEIIATDNGDATSFVPFQSTEREAFNGLVLAIAKAQKGAKGSFIVKAISVGLSSGTLSVELK
jgi:beta-galactosidase